MRKPCCFSFAMTRYGFRWGPLRVERIISDPKWGVVLRIGTDREQWEVRVSPKGRRMTVTQLLTVFWPDY